MSDKMESIKKSFFLVEDHSLMRKGILSYIEGHSDFVCAGCASGAEEFFAALAQGDSERIPHLLVTDLNLAGSLDGGLSLIRTCKERFPEVKILVYSMYADASVVSAALQAGANGYVSKLSEEPELAVAMDAVLSGKTYIEPQIATELVAYERSLSVFTRREMDILRLVLQGKSNAEIARSLSIQKRAVENYISRIYDKTGCWNRAGLSERFGKAENNGELPSEQPL